MEGQFSGKLSKSKRTRINGCFLAFALAKEFQRKSILNYNQSLSKPPVSLCWWMNSKTEMLL